MAWAVQVEQLSKRYRIRHAEERLPYRTLREDLLRAAAAPWRWIRGGSQTREDFWALRDVDLEVPEGEVLGLIGRNGAGKSTLLKILSRITKPTHGVARLRGRVGSLLEVGTGFHPELTGRENIFLSGTILGMSRADVQRNFDEIVDFSGVEKFLDTPAKRYSSGMFVRLGFAVAAHLNPEILVVDEVLAVGDAAFQQKCLGKMGDVARSGRTVLFVSHNLATIEALCSRVVVMEGGSVSFGGPPTDATSHYLQLISASTQNLPLRERTDRIGTGAARFVDIRLVSADGSAADAVGCGESVAVEVDIECSTPLTHPRCMLMFFNSRGHRLFRLSPTDDAANPISFERGGALRCRIRELTLLPGTYNVTARLRSSDREMLDEIANAVQLNVIAKDVTGTGRIPGSARDLFYLPCDWEIVQR